MTDLADLRSMVPRKARDILTLEQLRERIMAREDEPVHVEQPPMSQRWGTADEIAFVHEMQEKGRLVVLESMRRHVDIRRYDRGIDIITVRMAILSALSALETERQRIGGTHA